MLYCFKDDKNVTRDKKFLQSRFFVCFRGFAGSFLKNKKFFKPGARKFLFVKYKKILKVVFLHFPCSLSYFLKYKKFFTVSISWNIRKFRFLKYKDFFQDWFYLFFSSLGLIVHQVAVWYTTTTYIYIYIYNIHYIYIYMYIYIHSGSDVRMIQMKPNCAI